MRPSDVSDLWISQKVRDSGSYSTPLNALCELQSVRTPFFMPYSRGTHFLYQDLRSIARNNSLLLTTSAFTPYTI